MSQEQFTLTDWTNELSQCLQELVDYERRLEEELSLLRQRTEVALGVRTLGVRFFHGGWDGRIRDRVAGYWGILVDTPHAGYEYQRNVHERLTRLRDVLLEHPVLKAAVYRVEGGFLALNLNLATSRTNAHKLTYILMGLVDHAVEHSPQATADALAQLIQRGAEGDLRTNHILPFRGLHIERKHDFANGLSIIPFREVQRYMPDDIIRSTLETSDEETNREPVAAVVFERKWGPLIVPARFDMEGMDWPERPRNFREDALLLLSALAVSHGVQVVGTRTQRVVEEHQIDHLMGRGPLSFPSLRDVTGVNTMRIEPARIPAVSDEKLAECEQLLIGCMMMSNCAWRCPDSLHRSRERASMGLSTRCST